MLRFGVEIEVAKLSIQSATDMLRNNKVFPDTLGKMLSNEVNIINWFDEWQIKKDGSIRPYGSELVSPIFTWETSGQVFEMIDLLKRNRGKCNQSCGFHIHMSGNFPNKWNDMKPTIARWYERIKPAFKPARQRKDNYCSEELGQRKYQIVAPVIRAPEDINNYCEGIWKVTSPHIEVRLFNAHLCKRYIHRCLKATQELGKLLENLKSAVCQPA